MTETYTDDSTRTGATALLLPERPSSRRRRGPLRAAMAASSVGAEHGPQAEILSDAERVRRVYAETVAIEHSV